MTRPGLRRALAAAVRPPPRIARACCPSPGAARRTRRTRAPRGVLRAGGTGTFPLSWLVLRSRPTRLLGRAQAAGLGVITSPMRASRRASAKSRRRPSCSGSAGAWPRSAPRRGGGRIARRVHRRDGGGRAARTRSGRRRRHGGQRARARMRCRGAPRRAGRRRADRSRCWGAVPTWCIQRSTVGCTSGSATPARSSPNCRPARRRCRRTFRSGTASSAGSARAVVVVEASDRSGSLITAACALEQGRDVMAVPGSILGSRHRGGHALLRDGARLVETAADVLEELGLTRPVARSGAQAATPEHDRLLTLLATEGDGDLDLLAERSGLPVSVLLPRLLALELAGSCGARRAAGSSVPAGSGKVRGSICQNRSSSSSRPRRRRRLCRFLGNRYPWSRATGTSAICPSRRARRPKEIKEKLGPPGRRRRQRLHALLRRPGRQEEAGRPPQGRAQGRVGSAAGDRPRPRRRVDQLAPDARCSSRRFRSAASCSTRSRRRRSARRSATPATSTRTSSARRRAGASSTGSTATRCRRCSGRRCRPG